MSKKRVLSLIIVMSLFIQMFMVNNVMADKLPGAIWNLFEKEQAQEAANDTTALIETRLAIIALFDSWSDTSTQKLDIVAPRYQKIALSYEALLQYDDAVEILKLYQKYASLQETYGTWNHDAYLWAESKIKNLDLDARLYVKTDDVSKAVYYGEKYEPKVGSYFGAAYDKDTRIISSAGGTSYDWNHVSKFFPKKNSAYLIYLEFGSPIASFDRYFQQAKSSDTGVQLAWNVYDTFDSMSQYDAYITETATYLKALGIPVFLRYGGEMNIAEGMSDHEAFIDNYQYVTNKVRSIAPNVAMVWAPNEITESSRQLEDYYPGDSYVDWVGISTYTYYYFGDKTDWGDQQESIDNQFFTGPNANPLSKIREVVEFIGDRKPILISESGVAHYSKVAQQDMTEWAEVQLRRQYEYMPLLYPQIKGIFYFNVDSNVTKRNSYAFYTNQTIHNLYNDLIDDPHYLSDINDTLNYRYAEVGSDTDRTVTASGNSIELKTYVIVPGSLEPTVKYYLDNNLIATSTLLPYRDSIEGSQLSDGDHLLEVKVLNEDGIQVKHLSYTISKSASSMVVKDGIPLNIAGPLDEAEPVDVEEVSFSDVGNHWSKAYVSDVAKRGIIVGSEGKFRPDDLISRAEMTSIISKYGQLTQEAPMAFDDVSSDTWYYKYVSGAQVYLTGYGSRYYPTRNASREEIIIALVKLKGLDPSELTSEDKEAFMDRFSDVSELSGDNRDYLNLAVKYNIVGGYADGTLKPEASMKRGEVAKVLFTTFFQ